jgi:alkylation response protein AidB-like acyl-CoA dehydrogenase
VDGPVQERLLIADMGVATAEACYETTRQYIKERKAFGKNLVDLQTIRYVRTIMAGG